MAAISKLKEFCIADHRFHFFDGFFDMTNAEAIETELVHGLQHTWMHVIALEPDMIIMLDEIGFAGEHFHEEILIALAAIDIEIDQRIHTNGFDDLLLVCIHAVLRHGEIMSATEYHYQFAGSGEGAHYCFEGGISIVERGAAFYIAHIGNTGYPYASRTVDKIQP